MQIYFDETTINLIEISEFINYVKKICRYIKIYYINKNKIEKEDGTNRRENLRFF